MPPQPHVMHDKAANGRQQHPTQCTQGTSIYSKHVTLILVNVKLSKKVSQHGIANRCRTTTNSINKKLFHNILAWCDTELIQGNGRKQQAGNESQRQSPSLLDKRAHLLYKARRVNGGWFLLNQKRIHQA